MPPYFIGYFRLLSVAWMIRWQVLFLTVDVRLHFCWLLLATGVVIKYSDLVNWNSQLRKLWARNITIACLKAMRCRLSCRRWLLLLFSLVAANLYVFQLLFSHLEFLKIFLELSFRQRRLLWIHWVNFRPYAWVSITVVADRVSLLYWISTSCANELFVKYLINFIFVVFI